MNPWSFTWQRYASASVIYRDALHNLVTIQYAEPVWFAGRA